MTSSNRRDQGVLLPEALKYKVFFSYSTALAFKIQQTQANVIILLLPSKSVFQQPFSIQWLEQIFFSYFLFSGSVDILISLKGILYINGAFAGNSDDTIVVITKEDIATSMWWRRREGWFCKVKHTDKIYSG